MGGEGAMSHMVNTLKANKALLRVRNKRETPAAGAYTPGTNTTTHTPEEVQATIEKFRKERKLQARKTPLKIVLTLLLTALIILGLLYVYHVIAASDSLFNHTDINNL